MAKILESLTATIKIFQEAYPGDVCIIICSTERIYGYLPGKEVDLKLVVGEPMEKYEKSAAAQVLKTGQRIQKELGSEFLGVPYVVTASPIYEDGNLVGSISLAASNKKIDTMRTMSEELFETVESMASAADQIAISSNEVATFIQEVSGNYSSMVDDITNIDQVLGFIKKNAMQAKILGLNASIEAARAGQAGKGFAVVSNEIQKMGKESENSSQQINNQLTHIRKTIEELNESIQSIAANTEEHSASIEELRASFENIENMTKDLLEIAVS